MIYNEDCISGSPKHIQAESVHLAICDPPFGIEETKFGKHYNRNEDKTIDGYVEAPKDYQGFTEQWIEEAIRILSSDGSIYIISGWTNADIIGSVLRKSSLHVINKLIWHFSFGVATKKKFVTSHYEIYYAAKSKRKRVFNTYSRYGFQEKKDKRSLLYQDLQSVWNINKEYKPGQIKNKNKLPEELVRKMILYSSSEGNKVCDFFLGNFTTAVIAKKLNRIPMGFELNPKMFRIGIKKIDTTIAGSDLSDIINELPENQGKKLDKATIERICTDYTNLRNSGKNHKEAVKWLSTNYGRGIFSINNIIKNHSTYTKPKKEITDLWDSIG